MNRRWNSSVRGSLDPASESFSYTPGLRDASALLKWRFCIEDLADRADGAFLHLRVEPFNELPCAGTIMRDTPSARHR